MREILFKAKRLDNWEWVEGDFSQDKDLEQYYISGWRYFTTECGLAREPFLHEVDPSTVCQITGLKDKNGVMIFEGDILDIPGTRRRGIPAPVRYLHDQCQFAIFRCGYNPIWLSEYEVEKSMEVIGNIHNKEE